MNLYSVYRFVIIYLLSILFIYCPNSYSQSLSAEQIYKKVTNTVVVINAYDSNNKLAAQGSGVVFNEKGYVVTNYHVLSGNERLEIFHGKEIVPYVDIIGIDVNKDILILKIDAKKFPSIKVGNSNSLEIGQRVYAIGSPMGFENSISEGIISGLRSYDELNRNYIQITASISPGSSGGAVVNDEGELIGISTLTVKESQNLNFAIPVDDVLSVEIRSLTKNDEYKDFELFYKGNNASERGNYPEAIKYYSRFIEKYTHYANPYYNRGFAEYKLEDYISAIKDFNTAIEIDPFYVEAYNYRGNAKSDLEDNTGAIQDYNKAIEIKPNYAYAYYNRGIVKGNLENYRGAIQDYDKAIEIKPNYVEAYNNRGTLKVRIKDFIGAIKDLNRTIELYPNCADAYFNRAIAKFRLDDKAGACLDLSKAGELGIIRAYELIKQYCN
jgi:tetratricopeptide (TPR) repeat protein